MKNKMSILVAGILVALLVVGVIGARSAYAQSPASTFLHVRGPGDGRGLGLVELQVAAEALDMTTDELITALQSGKTLEQVAEDAGVDLQDVQDAIRARNSVSCADRAGCIRWNDDPG